MHNSYSLSKSADPMANMMLSSSIWLVLKKHLKNNVLREDDFNTLRNGLGLLESIKNGYKLINPLEESGFSPSVTDLNIFNDASGVLFRGKNSIDIDVLENYIKTTTTLTEDSEISQVDKATVKELADFFEKLTEQFFIHAKKHRTTPLSW